MTDKEVIIDCVNVSGCLHLGSNGLTDHKIPYCREFTGNCKAYPDCYYKQLQRKEQECEELKKKMEEYICSANCAKYIKAERYKQALDKIEKDVIKLICKPCKEGEFCSWKNVNLQIS